MKKLLLLVLFLTGCAAISRDCTSCWAEGVGSEWLVVQLSATSGEPVRCWKLEGKTSITSESRSDGIYWKDLDSGNMIHIAGFYNYIQVKNSAWEPAFKQLGITQEQCQALFNKTSKTEQ